MKRIPQCLPILRRKVGLKKVSATHQHANKRIDSKILFDLNSAVPKIENKNFVAEAAKVLQKGTSLSLIIEGYTCDLGSEAHNRDLAARRANAIRDLFVAQGVSPS